MSATSFRLAQVRHEGGRAVPFLRVPPQPLLHLLVVGLLDVVVTDKKGNLIVQPLTRDDFTVVEDKQVQQIRSFEGPDSHRMPQNATPIVRSACA